MISYDYTKFLEDHNDLVEVLIQEDVTLPESQLPHQMFFLTKFNYHIEPANCVAVLNMPDIKEAELADSTYFFVIQK